MSEQGRSPAQYAADIDGARDRLIAFVESCTADRWKAAPLQGDPRPVGVVADHVAHADEYLAGWMRQILRGEAVTVDSDYEDEHVLAFMDIGPLTPGHVLVVPRVHADCLEALDEELAADECMHQPGQPQGIVQNPGR